MSPQQKTIPFSHSNYFLNPRLDHTPYEVIGPRDLNFGGLDGPVTKGRCRLPYGGQFHMGYGMFSLWFTELWVRVQWTTMKTCRIHDENARRTGVHNLSTILNHPQLYLKILTIRQAWPCPSRRTWAKGSALYMSSTLFRDPSRRTSLRGGTVTSAQEIWFLQIQHVNLSMKYTSIV